MRRKIRVFSTLACLIISAGGLWAQKAYNSPAAGNPLLPGYFADPTVKKFGDDYYIYATTDGSGAGFGPAQLWTSKDFVNWTLMPMNWPDSHWIWAPDVMLNPNDGKYYLLYCQPCTLHLGTADTPRGPWHNVLGESEAVLVPDRFVHNVITLDGQTFIDDDGSIYLYWGTWGIYKDFGAGVGKLTPDLKSFEAKQIIPNTQATDFFEAPFVLKRNSKYYLMYSSGHCEDESYRVQYATADSPMGPYTYGGCILSTNSDGTIHGPGHHSVLQEGDDYYILYHRHDNPHSNRGFHRQVAVDKLEFAADGSIRPVKATHEGIGSLRPTVIKSPDLAFGKPVKASSAYDEDFRPEYAVDNNNGTLWRPKGFGQEWIEIDLGKQEPIKTVLMQPEYGTQFYQYMIEVSDNGRDWRLFADKTDNRLAGSPLIDFGNEKARYVRITFTGNQKRGFGGAVWNVKVYPEWETAFPQQWVGVTAADFDGRRWHNSEGMLGGAFELKTGSARTVRHAGKEGLELAPCSRLILHNPLISQSEDRTLTAQIWNGEEWTAMNTAGLLRDGEIVIESGNAPLTLTNLRYHNRKLEKPELDWDAKSDIVRLDPAPKAPIGKIIDLDFSQMNAGDTVTAIKNLGLLGGAFEAIDSVGFIEEKSGMKGLRFTSRETYRSNFAMPATLRDNTPFTIEVVFLNDSIAENECIADFTSSHDELEKIMVVNGTEPRGGVMQHYGWYEDAGWAEVARYAGKPQHLYVSFDGRMERVYINGELVSEKDIQLVVKPSQFATLGRNAEGEWPFTGLLQSITLYDEYLPFDTNNKSLKTK